MRIERLDIQAYGSFTERSIELPPNGMVIVLGPNEAGKSTLISFIRNMLYGWPKRSAVGQRYEARSGEMMAGRMLLHDREGGSWSIERQERLNDHFVRIHHISSDGQLRECTQQELEQQLLGGISLDMFKRLFAITLDELHELHTLQGDELRSMLHDVGMDAGRAIASSERKLQLEMDKLYKVRGRNQSLHNTLRELQDAERGKREQVKLESRFVTVEQEWKHEQAKLELLIQERNEAREQLSMMERAIQVSQVWIKLVTVQSELEALPDLSGWNEAWAESEQKYKQQIDEAELTMEEWRSRVATLEVSIADELSNKMLLQQASEVRRLIKMSDMVQHWRDNLHEADVEHDALEAELLRLTRQSGPQWTTEQLVSSQDVIGVAEEVNNFQHELDRSNVLVERAQEEWRRAEVDLQYANASAQEAYSAYERHMKEGILGSGVSPEDHTLNAWIRAWDEICQAPRRLASETNSYEVESRGNGQRRLAIVVAVIGLCAAIGLGVMQETIGAVVVAVLGLALAGWIMRDGLRERHAERSLASDRRFDLAVNSRMVEQMRMLETELELVMQATDNRIADSRASQVPIELMLHEAVGRRSRSAKDSSKLVRAAEVVDMKQLDAALMAAGAWSRERERLQQRVTMAHEANATQQRRHESSNVELDRVRMEYEERLVVWQGWLAQYSLPIGWGPTAVLAHVERVQQAMELVRRRERIASRAERLSEEYGAYREACVNAIAVVQLALRASDDGIAVAESAATLAGDAPERELARLLAHIEREEALEASAQAHARELAAAEQELLRLAERRERIAAERAGLWRQAGAADAASFQQLKRQAERYSACLTLERELEAACYRGGERAAFAPLARMLVEHDAATLEQRCERLREQHAALDRDIRAAEQQTGRLRQEEERLRAEAEREQWGQRAAELEAELDVQASRYVVHSLAKSIIAAVRTKYEREKQPYVYQRAGHYLNAMTAGRYTRVLSPLGTQQLAAQCEDGRIVDSTLLSRGTMEQLYLAMRLALADVMSEHTALPFIWDDIFVNFDPARLHQTLGVMPPLLEKRQVIWTTCHPHMAEAAQMIGDVPIIKL